MTQIPDRDAALVLAAIRIENGTSAAVRTAFWRSAIELSMTPHDARRLFLAGWLDRYFNGGRYRYKVSAEGRARAALNPQEPT
jgi:hypothetical protein